MKEKVTMSPARKVMLLLGQPLHVDNHIVCMSTMYISLIETLTEVFDGKHDNVSEQSFYMMDGIEDVEAKVQHYKNNVYLKIKSACITLITSPKLIILQWIYIAMHFTSNHTYKVRHPMLICYRNNCFKL
ncbi:ATP synthase subunit beta, putative [Medicago truncatula]|uniref:ATP synthase subunit beta, putative n=1 Tax=Medicago truncatula TaxID=3880 RepID=G7IPP3_MEDTR|nr:ATP synthase subunit beta, putative [Medicago truncatula]